MTRQATTLLCATILALAIQPTSEAALIGTNFDVQLTASVDTPGLQPPFGFEGHNGPGQTFDGLVEPLPANLNLIGAIGNDLQVADMVTSTGPMAESVMIEVTNPDGGPLFNGDLNTTFGPTFTSFSVTGISWGAGAGIATVSNAEISYTDANGAVQVLDFMPTITGDGTITPLGILTNIQNDQLEDGMQSIKLSFDVAHPIPEPANIFAIFAGLPVLMLFRRRK